MYMPRLVLQQLEDAHPCMFQVHARLVQCQYLVVCISRTWSCRALVQFRDSSCIGC